MNETRLLFSLDAEEAMLGSALLDPRVIEENDIEPDDFYINRHSWIWKAMDDLYRQGIKPDLITLQEELERRGQLGEVGGFIGIANLQDKTPTALGAPEYARIIKDYSQRRRMLIIANELAKNAYDLNSELSRLISPSVDALTAGLRPLNGARHISAFVRQVYEDVEERAKNPVDTWGIETGFKDFDRITGGLQEGEVLYIAGEPGIGKSKFAMQMGMNLGEHGHPGAIFSMEMSGKQMVRRAVSAIGEIATRKLKTGRMEDGDWPIFTNAIERAEALPIYISEETNLTTTGLRAELARLKSRHNIQWFVLDYLFLMTDGEGKLDDTERTALLSRRIKIIARNLNIAGVTVNSVVKEGMDNNGSPSKKNMRGSGQVIHDADLIMFLLKHQPNAKTFEHQDDRLRTAVFTKAREIESLNYFHLVAFPTYPKFGDYVPDKRIPF